MRQKHIMALFFILLPLSIVARYIQMVSTVDASTGFFLRQSRPLGIALLIFLLAAAAASATACAFSFYSPERPPKVNPVLGLSSCLLAVAIAYELVTKTYVASMKMWQIVATDITCLLSAIFFLLYGLKMILDFPVPDVASIVLPIYGLIKLICTFTSIAALSLISDTVITLACECASLLFLLNAAKLLCGIPDDRLFRKVLSSGLATSLLCLSDALPRVFLTVTHREQYLHSAADSAFTNLALGLFALAFTLSYFAKQKKDPPVESTQEP